MDSKELEIQKKALSVFVELKDELPKLSKKVHGLGYKHRNEWIEHIYSRYNNIERMNAARNDWEKMVTCENVHKWLYDLFAKHLDFYGYFNNYEVIIAEIDDMIQRAERHEFDDIAGVLSHWRKKLLDPLMEQHKSNQEEEDKNRLTISKVEEISLKHGCIPQTLREELDKEDHKKNNKLTISKSEEIMLRLGFTVRTPKEEPEKEDQEHKMSATVTFIKDLSEARNLPSKEETPGEKKKNKLTISALEEIWSRLDCTTQTLRKESDNQCQ